MLKSDTTADATEVQGIVHACLPKAIDGLAHAQRLRAPRQDAGKWDRQIAAICLNSRSLAQGNVHFTSHSES